MDKLIWHLYRIWEPIYRFCIRTIHSPKNIDFDDTVEAPKDYSGTWVTFWPSGKIKLRVQMVNGIEHGQYICYHKNGSILQIGEKNRGHCHGEWKDYSILGWHFKTTQYDDHHNFTVTFFRLDGSIINQSEWEDGCVIRSQDYPEESKA